MILVIAHQKKQSCVSNFTDPWRRVYHHWRLTRCGLTANF